jgi:sulfur-oxidizing protein SoxY
MKRRSFLKGSLASSVVTVAINAGLLTPSTVLAQWNAKAFKSNSTNDALNNLFGTEDLTTSSDIKLKLPEISENGAVTPITVDATNMTDVESIAIIATKNRLPLICVYNFSGSALGYVSTRIKLAETQDVVAIVKAGGKLHKASQEVKVTIGGCG